MDDLRNLAVFATVVRQGSMSGAARVLSMSPSAVSQQIRQLERNSGVTLLVRSTRKLQVTAAGERCYEACAAMMIAVEQARAELGSARAEPSGELRMAVPVGFARHAQSALSGMLSKYLALRLSIIASDMATNLVESRIDLAVTFASSLPDSDWSARWLGRFDFWLCASPAYLDRHTVPTAPEQLATHEWLAWAHDTRPLGVTLSRRGHSARDVVAVPRIVSYNQEVVQNGCLSGYGLAVLSSLEAADLVSAGALVRVLPEWDMDTCDMWALTPQRDAQPSKVKLAIKSLQDYLARAPGVRRP